MKLVQSFCSSDTSKIQLSEGGNTGLSEEVRAQREIVAMNDACSE